MSFNYLDIGLFIFLLGFGIAGFIIGFTEKVFSIISWAGSAILTYYTYDWVHPWVQKWIQKPSIASLVTSIGLFLIYLALFSLLSKGIHDRIQKSMFKKADRYLGAFLGLGTGYLALMFAALICRTIIPSSQYPEWSKDSVLWNSAEQGGNFMERFLPLHKPTTTFLPQLTLKSSEHTPFIKNVKPLKKKEAIHKKPDTQKKAYSIQDRKELSALVKEYT